MFAQRVFGYIRRNKISSGIILNLKGLLLNGTSSRISLTDT